MSKIQAERYHDISCGHRVYGHESKCAHLHGHNYRFHFTIESDSGLDEVGRVMDFSVIKSVLCQWLEDNWDHKMLIWKEDPISEALIKVDYHGIHLVDFNPTAENIAEYFVDKLSPMLLEGTGCKLVKLKIEETRKCSAIYEK